MALDLSNTNNILFDQLTEHEGHELEIAVYGKEYGMTEEVSLECNTCGMVLISVGVEE